MPTAPGPVRTYPDRDPATLTTAGPSAPALPIVRLWPFALQETTAGDRRAASPFLNGPAIIDELYLNAQNDNAVPLPTISVWYGPTVPPSGNATLGSIAELGTPIFTDGVISTELAGQYQTPIQHILKASGEAATMRIVLPLRFYISLERFQLLIQYGTQTAGSQILTGYFRILERVPPEQIPNFL